MVRTINILVIKMKNTDKITEIYIKDRKSFKISKTSKLFYVKSTDDSEIYFPINIIVSISFKRKWMYNNKWKLSEEQISIKD